MAEYAQLRPLALQTRRLTFRVWPLAIVSLILAFAGLNLAAHYPLAPVLTTFSFVACCIAFFRWSDLWLLLVPALLPIVGFAPWTGWITFEELDMLMLAASAGGYASLAWRSTFRNAAGATSRGERESMSGLMWLLTGLFAISTLSAMFRGFADAGGFNFGWFQGYLESMNSFRIAKSFFAALLFIPLWQMARQQNPQRAVDRLFLGVMVGLAAAAGATVWERSAFTDLLNFSSDYRTTGSFWEMHVGGAALDGYLALTMPFALRELMTARTSGRWCVAAGVTLMATYACLTTFSRGVYLALPVGILVFAALSVWQRKQFAPLATKQAGKVPTREGLALPAAFFLISGFAVGAFWMFQTSGYRGMAAFLAVAGLMLPLANVLRSFRAKDWSVGVVLGALFVPPAFAISLLVPKGAYWVMAAAALLTAVSLVRVQAVKRPSSSFGAVAFAGFLTSIAAAAFVANHWGGSRGLAHAALVLPAVFVVCIAAAFVRKPLWPENLRWQATTVAAMGALAAMVGIFGGGAYMSERFSTGGQDFGGRLAHWHLGREMLRTDADLWLGKGLGRFPANYFLVGNPQEHPGDYRLRQEGDNTYVVLAGGLNVTGWGDILRVSQRVAVPDKDVNVTARIRTDKDTEFHFEVCEKHLLYNGSCVTKNLVIKGAPGVWQAVRANLEGAELSRGNWFAPRLIAFSMATTSRGSAVDVDDVELTDRGGARLLANGDFSRGLAQWFFSSDRNHLPWHIKSVFMNVFFEQGIVGATLCGLLFACALWRTVIGSARQHPLAPALAAGMVGFATVGLFDSLLDVPRLSWMFYFLLLVALTIRLPTLLIPERSFSGKSLHKAPSASVPASVIALIVVAVCAGVHPAPALANDAEFSRQIIRVGPDRIVKTIARASRLAKVGALIEVDAGQYVGDVAVWTRDRLTVRTKGGRVVLRAAGKAAEGKAIWVVRASGMVVEGFDFEGAAVPSRNGAGIRLESGSLLIRDCSFMHNEMGLLTNNDHATVLEIENSEFAYNQRPDGHNHNLYVGQIARLSVTGSYFHHARIGHLLKSRAALNQIFYNRLTDEAGGTASYELEFPNGGVAYVVGNVIQQNIETDNPQLISFGAEGYAWPRNEIYLVNNTLINPLPFGGVFLKVAAGANVVRGANNLLVGQGMLESAGPGDYQNNYNVAPSDFAQAAGYDFRLKSSSRAAGKAVDPGFANGQRLQPQREYEYPRTTRAVVGAPHNPGAMQRMAP